MAPRRRPPIGSGFVILLGIMAGVIGGLWLQHPSLGLAIGLGLGLLLAVLISIWDLRRRDRG